MNDKLRHIVVTLIVLAINVGASHAASLADTRWFRYGQGVEAAWNVDQDPARPDWILIHPKNKALRGNTKRVLVMYPRPSSAYDVAITKILQVFEAKDLNAELTVVNFRMNDDTGKGILRFAERAGVDLIMAMGSETTAWLFENYRGGKLAVVSVCSKDPVQLGQMPDYEKGSKNNFAFTSLNVPVEVQMAYVRDLNPNLRNLAILVDSKNVSAVQTQAEPTAAFARQRGVQVIWGAVQDPSRAREELVNVVRDAVQTMRKSDPDLTRSLFWVTGSTSVFLEIKTINENSDRVPVVSVVPEIVRAGSDSAVLGIGISFESNAHLAAIYAVDILEKKVAPGDLKVGVVSPPDIAISFLKAREIGMKVPFTFFETASFVYDYDGRPVRTIASKMGGEN